MKNNLNNLTLSLSRGLICIFTIMLFHNSLFGQSVDTASWSFTSSQSSGKTTFLTNKVTYMGKVAGTVKIPISFNISSVDTSAWSFVPSGVDGTFRQVINRTTFYGNPRIPLSQISLTI